jgi:hypothetical protein
MTNHTNSTEPINVPVPVAIKQLIDVHNQTLQNSLRNLQDANLELMHMMNLLPEDGWRLDMEHYRYVKLTAVETPAE